MSLEPTRDRPAGSPRPRERAGGGAPRAEARPDDASEFAFSTEIDPQARADEKQRSAQVVSRNLLSLFDFDC